MKPPLSNGTFTDPDQTYPAPNSHEVNARYPLDIPEPDHNRRAPARPAPADQAMLEPAPPVPPSSGNPLLSNLIFLLTGALITYVGLFVTRQPATPPIQIQPPPTIAPTSTPIPTATAEPITVFVSGAVHSPGLYELVEAARVGEVLELAGGLLPDAEAALINQAERLFDGAQIHVPSAIQVVEVETAPVGGSPPLLNNQPPAGISGSAAPALSSVGSGSNLINVNTASAAELETLPGVGASRAAEIIAGRPYGAIDELQKVSGIGVKTVEKLRPLVRVE